jgi:hypothetical protein
MTMTRLTHILFVALLLGPPVGTRLAPTEAGCEQARDCCAPDGTCDDSCVACPCCPGPAPNVAASVEAGPLAAPPGPATPAPGAAVLPLLSTDILHIPKSL